MRTKADFKAARESVGLTQLDVATACGVRVLTVKRWEKPGWPDPPEDAWGYLGEMVERHDEMVDYCVETMREQREATGVASARLTYFRDQAQYDATGRDPGSYGFVNAVSRDVARALDDEGFDVSFAYPDDGAIRTPGSRY